MLPNFFGSGFSRRDDGTEVQPESEVYSAAETDTCACVAKNRRKTNKGGEQKEDIGHSEPRHPAPSLGHHRCPVDGVRKTR